MKRSRADGDPPARLCYQHGVAGPARAKRETRNVKRSRSAQAERDLAPIRRAARQLHDRRDYAVRAIATSPHLDSEANIARMADLFDRALAVGAISSRAVRVLAGGLRVARMNLKGLRRDLAAVGLDRLPDSAYHPPSEGQGFSHAGEPVRQTPSEGHGFSHANAESQ